MATKSTPTEAEETAFKFGRDGGFEINFKRKRPHKENPLQVAQATLPKPVEPQAPRPMDMMPLAPIHGVAGEYLPQPKPEGPGQVPTVNNHFRANQAGVVVDFDKKKQQMLEGGYMPRGGGPRGGSADVVNMPGRIERQTQAPMSDAEKFHAAVMKQQGRVVEPKVKPPENPQGDIKSEEFYNFVHDFNQKLRVEEPFKVLDKRFVHESLKSFYKDPQKALDELKEGIPHTKGDLQKDAVRLHDYLANELYGDE